MKKAIFEDAFIDPSMYVIFFLAIVSHFPQLCDCRKEKRIIEEQIDRIGGWAYFDGDSQGNPDMGGDGGILFILDTHWFKLSSSLGSISNNHNLCL